MLSCIPQQIANKIKEALKGKDITISKLFDFPSSVERIKFLEKYAGKSAESINLLFEKKFILKNQYIGYKNFIDKISASKRYDPVRITEMKKSLEEFKAKQQERIFSPKEGETFLKAFAEKLTGLKANKEQFGELHKLQIASDELKKGYDETKPTGQKWISDKTAKNFGASKVILENYTNELKSGGLSLSGLLEERMGQFKETMRTNKPKAMSDLLIDTLKTISDYSISMVATFDNSFIGRQGLKTLMTHPKIWYSMAKNSFSDFYKTLTGKNARDALWADVYSRENYLDGSYDIAKLIPKTEEQFPQTLFLEKILIIGKIFKASENSFVGSAIRSRIDLFDFLSEKARNNGVDMTNEYQIKSLGTMINSLTARGQWGKRGEGTVIRLIFWAPRMLKGNIDVLTGHLGQDISPFARKQAAINLLKIVGTTASVMAIANAIKPGSAETDPRSSDFGKIKVGNTRFDFTGGASSLITLASRLLSNSTKSSTTGIVSQFGSNYGQTSRMDILINFLEGKTTPPIRALVDYLKEQNFQGKKPTIESLFYQTFTPISIQNVIQLKDDNSANAVLGVILDVMGINANTYQPYQTDWNASTSKELLQFKTKVGNVKFKEANELYNKTYNEWYNGVKVNIKFQVLSDELKLKVITNKKAEIKDMLFKKYGFRYIQEKTTKIPKF